MNSFTVYKILQHGDNQLLLISQADGKFNLAVYNEHTGNTLMRMTEPTLSNLEAAIKIIKGESTGDY